MSVPLIGSISVSIYDNDGVCGGGKLTMNLVLFNVKKVHITKHNNVYF